MNESNGKTRNRRHFTAEDKATILKRHLADKVAISDLCEEYHIQPSLFSLWQRQALENLSAAFRDGRTERGHNRPGVFSPSFAETGFSLGGPDE